jgi:hypothetical protein
MDRQVSQLFAITVSSSSDIDGRSSAQKCDPPAASIGSASAGFHVAIMMYFLVGFTGSWNRSNESSETIS